MRGTTTWLYPEWDLVINVSKAAQRLIGAMHVAKFVEVLATMMEALGANQAYVSKRGCAVDIHVLRNDGWQDHIQLRRGP